MKFNISYSKLEEGNVVDEPLLLCYSDSVKSLHSATGRRHSARRVSLLENIKRRIVVGKVDDIVSPYLRKPKNFCGFVNSVVYHGKDVLKPENMIPLEREKEILFDEDSKGKKNKSKKSVIYDALMQVGINGTYIVYVCENQKEVHYGMPVRMMLYEAMEYAEQMKELKEIHREKNDLKDSAEFLSGMSKDDKLHMIVPIVFYFGENPWDGPLTLDEMIEFPEEMEDLKEYLPNYKIHLVEPYNANLDDFSGDWKIIMEVLQLRKDKQKLLDYMNTNEENLSKLHKDSQRALLAMIGGEDKLMDYEKEKGGNYGMCTALRELLQDSKELGEQRILTLIDYLVADGKLDELTKISKEKSLRDELYKAYGIE